MFAGIVQSFAVSRPGVILPMLLPQLCSSIESLITDEILDDEELDKTLLFHLLLFSSVKLLFALRSLCIFKNN